VLAPFALYVLAVSLLGDWLIDDAGISLAYARNLAQGHGLVAQPGQAPVEGFSNFLWVIELALAFGLRLAPPVMVAKLLGAMAVLGAFYRLYATMRALTQREAPGTVLLALLACSPPVVVWTSSGLENGLTLFLVAALVDVLVQRPTRAPLVAATLGALLAMNRPDGLVYGLATLALFTVEAIAASHERARRAKELAAFACFFAVFTGAFFAFRLHTFGLVWPHTYAAKREHESLLAHARALVAEPTAVFARLNELAHGTAGALGPALFFVVALTLVSLAMRARIDRRVGAIVVLFGAAAAAFVFLERDWMGEYRFATGAIALTWTLMVLTLDGTTRERRYAFATVSGLGIVAAVVHAVPRLLQFSEAAPTTYQRVSAETGLFATFAEALHLSCASVLTADVGAELMESPLRVYDLAGLCEPEVVKTLKGGSPRWLYDHPAFFAWVFEGTKPTFIVTRAFWTNVAALTSDPRFTRDYAAVDAYEDRYVARVYGRYARSGVFVRRDALATPEALETLRSTGMASASSAKAEAPIVSVARALGLRPPAAVASLPLELGAAAVHAARLDEEGQLFEGRAAWQHIASRAHSEGNRLFEAQAHERLATAERTFGEEALRTRRASSVQLIDEGLRAYRVGDHATAIKTWGLVSANDPQWATAQNNRASSFIFRREFERAEEALENARYVNPNEPLFERNKRWLDQERARATDNPQR